MSISFVTIQPDNDSKWNIVQKTFPQSSGRYTIECTKAALDFVDAKTAETAARLLANEGGLQYVPENRSVIGVVPYIGKNYMIVELHPSGGFQARSYATHIQAVIRTASALSEALQFPLVLPAGAGRITLHA